MGGGLRPPPTVDLSIDVDQPVRYGGRGLDMTRVTGGGVTGGVGAKCCAL